MLDRNECVVVFRIILSNIPSELEIILVVEIQVSLKPYTKERHAHLSGRVTECMRIKNI